MTGERRKFRREGEEVRREALISASLSLASRGGAEALTVRAIAEQAGVTQGLIRHYFHSKEDLTRAAYAALMDRMIRTSDTLLAEAPAEPRARLASFVSASLRPPVMDTEELVLWAAFLHRLRADPEMRTVHETRYLAFRDRLQMLIAAALPAGTPPQTLRARAIACNAVIDGLWLEGSALPEAFGPDEILTIGLTSVGAIVGLDLIPYLPEAAA